MACAGGTLLALIRHSFVRVTEAISALAFLTMVIDVVLPCLNEARALPFVLSRMPAGYRPIVADNGSDDGSAEVAARYGAVVVPVPQRGFGAACHGGMMAATAEIICFMDADGSLDPADLPVVAGPGTCRVGGPGARPSPAARARRLAAARAARQQGRRGCRPPSHRGAAARHRPDAVGPPGRPGTAWPG